jgi:hypothetical protein
MYANIRHWPKKTFASLSILNKFKIMWQEGWASQVRQPDGFMEDQDNATLVTVTVLRGAAPTHRHEQVTGIRIAGNSSMPCAVLTAGITLLDRGLPSDNESTLRVIFCGAIYCR